MTDWEKERRDIIIREIIYAAVMLAIIIVGIICDVCVSHGLVFLEVINMDGFSLTLLQLQVTMTTLSIAIIALLSGTISESYMGISISKFFLDIKPFVCKQKYIIFFEFGLIVCSVGSHLFRWYNMVFSFAAISLGGIVVSVFKVYEAFKGRRNTFSEIERYISNAFEKEKDYTLFAENFISDWKNLAYNQSDEEFEHYYKLFFVLIERILKKEKNVDDINSFTEGIARFLLEHSLENCKLKGLIFVENYYNNLWRWILDNSDDAIKLEKPISLLNRISREWYCAFNSIDAEMIEERLGLEYFSDSVIRVAVWIGNSSNDFNKKVSILYTMVRVYGGYTIRQKEKGNIINNKYWENLISDSWGYYPYNIPEPMKNLYLEALALRDFNVCYGYLMSGQINFVIDAIFLDGIANTYTINSEEFVLKIVLVHCYMYYLAFCENEDCIDVGLQKRLKEALIREDVVASVQNFIYRLSENSAVISENFEAKLEDTIIQFELFPKHATGKIMIIDNIAREYFLYFVLILERYSISRDIVSRLLQTKRYSQYLSDVYYKGLRDRLLNMSMVFENGGIDEHIIDNMLSVFVNVLSEKFKKSLLEEAAVHQREYEQNEVQCTIEGEIKKEFTDKISNVFNNHILNKAKRKKYKKLCVLNRVVPTQWIEHKSRESYADQALGSFTSWLIDVLKKDFDFEVVERKISFDSDLEFRNYLKDNGYSELVGSEYTFGCTDYNLHAEHTEFLKSQICKFIRTCNKSVALKKNALFVSISNVQVDILSPELCDYKLEKNDETEKYTYSPIQGIALDFEEKEIKEYLHDDQKIIRISIDVEVGVSIFEKQKAGVIVCRDSI